MYMLWKITFYLINQHIHHLTYLAILVLVKTFKFYFLSTCQLYNTVLSIIVTIFYMRSSICISLISWKIYHLLTSLFPPHPGPWQPLFYSVSDFLRIHTQEVLCSIWVFFLAYFTGHNVKVHQWCHKWQYCFSWLSNILFIYTTSYLLSSQFYWGLIDIQWTAYRVSLQREFWPPVKLSLINKMSIPGRPISVLLPCATSQLPCLHRCSCELLSLQSR